MLCDGKGFFRKEATYERIKEDAMGSAYHICLHLAKNFDNYRDDESFVEDVKYQNTLLELMKE